MPHLTLEYSDNLDGFDARAAVAAINQASVASGLFGESDIKTRALRLDCWQVGIESTPRAFAHVRIALLSGRTDEERKALAEAVLAALQPRVPALAGGEVQLSVETVDLDRPSYAKAVRHG